jgi:hypothetical protein
LLPFRSRSGGKKSRFLFLLCASAGKKSR